MIDDDQKLYRLRPDQIEALATGLGYCFATDMITVDGRKVGFMYRESPEQPEDSGWRFAAGLETEEYMNNSDNLSLYDVNTIANYDREIIPLLKKPIGSAFERRNGEGPLVEVDDFDPDDG